MNKVEEAKFILVHGMTPKEYYKTERVRKISKFLRKYKMYDYAPLPAIGIFLKEVDNDK